MISRIQKEFADRPDMARLCCAAVQECGWTSESEILIVGAKCGDYAHICLQRYGIDAVTIDEEAFLVEYASQRYPDNRYMTVKMDCLPFPDGSFHGVYVQSAFSRLKNKLQVCAELFRVAAPGAKLVLNDFVFLHEGEEGYETERDYIPCFPGVQARQCYEALFRNAGFRMESSRLEGSEMYRLGAWICGHYRTTVPEMGVYLSRYYGVGGYKCTGSRKCPHYDVEKMNYWHAVFSK